MQNLSNNSIQTNRDLLKQLTAQIINIKQPSEALKKQVRDVSDELKRQEGALGDTRRNVGNYFNEFAKGVPKLGQAVDGLKNVGLAFQSAGGGVKGFTAALATTGLPLLISGMNLLIEAFSTFEPLADAVNDIMAGLSASFATSYAEGVKLSRLKRELEINDRNQLVTNAQLKKSITELEAVAANKAANDADRIAALTEANNLRDKQLEIDKQDLAEKQKVNDLEVKLSKESNKNKAALLGTIRASLGLKATEIEANKELLKQQKQLEADKVALEERAFQQTQDNRNKIALLQKQIAEDNKTANDEAAKAAKERTDKEKKESDERIKQAQKEADEKLRIEQKHAQDVSNLEIEFALTDRQRLEDSFSAKQALLNANNEEELALINTIETAKQEALKQYDEKLIAQNAKTLATITSQYSTSAKEQTEIEKNAFEEKKQIKEAELSFASTISNGLIGLVRNVADATGASAAFNKVLALVEIGTQTAIALATGIASSQNLPYPGNLVAMGSTIAAVLGAIGSAFAILSKTPEAPKPSFAEGGRVLDIGGRSHADGGTPIHVNGQYVAEAEAGEGMFIMKKDAYRDIEMLSGWNQKYGGRSWGNSTRFAADGGSISLPTSDGGFSTRQITDSVNNSLVLKQAIREGFAKAPAPELSIVELNNKQNSRSRSISISEL